MNTTAIIAAIIALLGGLAVGANFEKGNEATQEAEYSQTRERTGNENPAAADFVSLRPGVSGLPVEALSNEETAGLLLMREEEKLARDVYQTLYDQWGLQIFANIAQSEQTHTEAVYELLVKYDLTDPVTDDSIGVFKNSDLQTLYNELTARGAVSEVAALTVGATIEDLDINDLQRLIGETDNADILLVYNNLVRGSRNHLRSFTKQLTMRGESYVPQYISTTDYQSILDSNQETGQASAGSGNRGWGKRK